jgi:hypothetical protein
MNYIYFPIVPELTLGKAFGLECTTMKCGVHNAISYGSRPWFSTMIIYCGALVKPLAMFKIPCARHDPQQYW